MIKNKNTLILLLLALMSFPFSFSAQTAWQYSLEEAKIIAQAEGKLIIADFWAHWCGPCKDMDSRVWSEVEVQLMLQNFVPAKINTDQNRTETRRYNIRGIPDVLILDASGEELYRRTGFTDKTGMMKLLDLFAVRTSAINKAMARLMENEKNAYAACGVGEQYQSAAVKLPQGPGRSVFLARSEDFLEKSLKLANPDKDTVLEEKLQLLLALNEILNGHSKKGIRTIEEKYAPENVRVANYSLACFALALGYREVGNNDKLATSLQKLEAAKDGRRFLRLLEEWTPPTELKLIERP